jgi:hypothetical protein
LTLDEQTERLMLAPLRDVNERSPSVEDLLLERRRSPRVLDKKP